MKTSKIRYVFIASILGLVALFVFFPHVGKDVKRGILDVCKPTFQISAASARIKNLVNSRPQEETACQTFSRVQQEYLVQIQELTLENQRLKALLNFTQETTWKTIPARIIERGVSLWRKTAIIDKGRKEGIHAYMPVVAAGGLVGIVADAGDKVSRILLVNDPDFRVSIMIQRTRDEGVMEGNVQGECKVKYLPLHNEIKPDDVIITSGLGKIFPKGILIGTIKSVGKDRLGLYTSAEIILSADIGHLEEVLCVVEE